MVHSFLDRLLHYEKCDDDEEEQQKLEQSCSDSELESGETSVTMIATPMGTEAGAMKWKLRPANGGVFFFRPSLLHLVFFLILILLVYSWIFSKVDRIQNLRRKAKAEDAFDQRITLFMSGQGGNSTFTVFKKITVEGRFGDFSCSTSMRRSKCAFRVENVVQAAQICKAYDEVCKAFVLTEEKDGLVAYLKHDVTRVQKSNVSALFVKKYFVPKSKGLRFLTSLASLNWR